MQYNELLYVNKEFENITGYTKEEAIGKNCNFLQNDDKEQKAAANIKEAFLINKKFKSNYETIKKMVHLFYNFSSISPVYDQEDNITHFVGIQKDITQAKKTRSSIIRTSKTSIYG